MAVGLAGPTVAMFHLTTHAFFKALLFLGAGSVILAVHHEQDIWKMGGLRSKMPTTFRTFLVGTLALAGVPPFSGFYSKDGILAQAVVTRHYGLFLLGLFVAVLTAFYMFRLVFVVFGGTAREKADHAHESPSVIVWPLLFLALLSIIGGWISVENVFNAQFATGEAGMPRTFLAQLILPFVESPLLAVLGIGAAALGFGVAYALYRNATQDPLPAKLGVFSKWMRNRFYFDELYQRTFIRFHDLLAAIADWFDRWIISGLVLFTHGTTELAGRALRLVQTGNLQAYAFLFAMGVAVVLFLVLK
jgi:NADH-quinone oxidoreductase subunit L